MKKLYVLLFFLAAVFCGKADAQAGKFRQSGMEMSFGVNTFPVQLTKSIGFKPWEALSFNLMQRFYAEGGGAVRAALDLFILPSTYYKYSVYGFGLGYAQYFDVYYPNVRFFAGGDFRIQQLQEEFRDYMNKDFRIGIMPNIGLQYRILRRLSLSTEISFFLAMRQRRTDAFDIKNSYLDHRKIDFVARQNRMLGLDVGFWF